MPILQTEIGTNEIGKVTCIKKKTHKKTTKNTQTNKQTNKKQKTTTSKPKVFKEVDHCKNLPFYISSPVK